MNNNSAERRIGFILGTSASRGSSGKSALIVVGLTSLVVGIGGTYVAMNRSTFETKSVPVPSPIHNHAMVEIDPGKPIPTISIESFKDSKDGYNLHLITTNFEFSPQNVGGANAANTGHAHLYVNGTKIARLYGPWFNVSADVLKEGENTIEVTLNANDHSEWTIAGQHIGATVTMVK